MILILVGGAAVVGAGVVGAGVVGWTIFKYDEYGVYGETARLETGALLTIAAYETETKAAKRMNSFIF